MNLAHALSSQLSSLILLLPLQEKSYPLVQRPGVRLRHKMVSIVSLFCSPSHPDTSVDYRALLMLLASPDRKSGVFGPYAITKTNICFSLTSTNHFIWCHLGTNSRSFLGDLRISPQLPILHRMVCLRTSLKISLFAPWRMIRGPCLTGHPVVFL